MALATLRVLTICAALALVALILYAGEPGSFWWWLLAIPFSVWIIGPSLLPFYFAQRAERTVWLHWLMVGCLLLSSAWSGREYYNAFFVSESSTAALVMIFVPLYQWGALLLVGLLSHLVSSRLPR